MRVLDRDLQFVWLDAHVGLERGDAFRRPVINGPARILGPGQRVQLWRPAKEVADIGAGNSQLGSRLRAGIDQFLQCQVCVRFHASRGARSRDAARQVQARCTVGRLAK